MPSKPILRGSNRLKDGDKRKVVDETSRKRRHRKLMESLETDNFHDDPHADLVMSKKIPKFDDSLESRTRRHKKERNAEYYSLKYRKTFQQLVEEQQAEAEEEDIYCYTDIAVDKSNYPPQYFCAVCGFFSSYICVSCGARYCNIKCLETHQDTRCLKWTN